MSGLLAGLVGLQITFAPGLTVDDYLPFETATLERCERLAERANSTAADDPNRAAHHTRAGHCLRFAVPRPLPCPDGRAGEATDVAITTINRAVYHLSHSDNPLDLAFAKQLPDRVHEIANQCVLRAHLNDHGKRAWSDRRLRRRMEENGMTSK